MKWASCARHFAAAPAAKAPFEELVLESLAMQAMGVGAFALAVALVFYFKVKSAPEGNEAMARIARFIREGAMAFLAREYKVLAAYAAVVFALLAWKLGLTAGLSFLSGAFLSLLAGFFGMKAATFANVRTAEAARAKGKAAALVLALGEPPRAVCRSNHAATAPSSP